VGVQDPTFFPHSAICKLVMRFSGASGEGTGFYIAPNRILTAAHNLVVPGQTLRSMEVKPGHANDMSTFGSFTVTGASRFVVHPSYSGSGDFDLAVLKVDTPPPHGAYFDVEELRMSPASGIVVCGYAAEGTNIDRNRQHMDVDTIRDLNAETFTYALHARRGTSGSPTFYVSGGQIKAVGVLSRTGDRYHNVGCRITDAKLSWIRSV
jgi:V8-like Glu-specific endopeptidase